MRLPDLNAFRHLGKSDLRETGAEWRAGNRVDAIPDAVLRRPVALKDTRARGPAGRSRALGCHSYP